jgi:hypothetical protein
MDQKIQPVPQHRLIASDQVEGTAVRRPNGDKIGTIDRLMIEKLSGQVAYAVLSFGGFLGMGEKYMPLPWAKLAYHPRLESYVLDLSDADLDRAPCYDDYTDFDWSNRERELEVHRFHHTRPYWAQ